MWLILQLILAIVYFAGIPALASVPAVLFFVPVLIWAAIMAFVGFVFCVALIAKSGTRRR